MPLPRLPRLPRRVRRALHRSPLAYWAVAATLALTTSVVVGRLVARAEAQADRLGRARVVTVATRAVPAGSRLAAADVTTRAVPVAFLPRARPADRPLGRTVVVPLLPGEVVAEPKLAPAGLSGVAALLPEGTRAVAVPRGLGTPDVRRGDAVDVLATPAAPEGPPTFPVARSALVVDADDETVTVAVDPAEAARIAFALGAGSVTLVLVAPG